jgi:hypothetical protein
VYGISALILPFTAREDYVRILVTRLPWATRPGVLLSRIV